MAELLAVLLALVVLALSAVLTVVAWLGSRKFDEPRFLVIALAFLTLSVTGLLALLSEFYNFFDEAFAVEPAPLVLLVVALGLLYLALFQGRRRIVKPDHG